MNISFGGLSSALNFGFLFFAFLCFVFSLVRFKMEFQTKWVRGQRFHNNTVTPFHICKLLRHLRFTSMPSNLPCIFSIFIIIFCVGCHKSMQNERSGARIKTGSERDWGENPWGRVRLISVRQVRLAYYAPWRTYNREKTMKQKKRK